MLLKQLLPALERGEKRGLEVDVTNTDRTFGTIFGSEITRRYPEGMEEDSYVIQCKGAGGQSFGAFIPRGLTLELTGDSNDYFGKGLSGGKLVVFQPKGVKFKSDENIIIGNVADDDVFKTVDMYFRGLWNKEKVLNELRYYKMNNQICIVKQEALDCLLTFQKAYEVNSNGK